MLRTDIKKFIGRFDTNISILLVVISLFWGAMRNLILYFQGIMTETAFYFYDSSLFSGITDYAMPVFVAVPLSRYLCEELEYGYFHFEIMRTTKRKYIMSKICVAIFSGVYIMTAGSLLFYLLLNIMGIPVMHDADATLCGLYEDTAYYALAQQGKGMLASGLHMMNYALTAIPWTILVLAACMYVKNQYILMVLPILVNKILILIGFSDERLSFLNPVEWNTMLSMKVYEELGGFFYVLKVMAIIVCIGSFVFCLGMRRKIKNG